MVDIYISWCKGLDEDKEALRTIINDDLVKGVESYAVYGVNAQYANMRAAGVPTSMHNPLNWFCEGLDDPQAVQTIAKEDVLKSCQESAGAVIGMHLFTGMAKTETFDIEKAKGQAVANTKAIKQLLPGKTIALELPPLWSDTRRTKRNPAFLATYRPAFISSIMQETGLWLLLDFSHTLVSLKTMRKESLYAGSADEYFDELLDRAAENIAELHVATPTLKDGSTTDSDRPLSMDDPVSILVMHLAKKVLERAKNVKTITLEVNTGLPPKEHVKTMLAQARLLDDYVLSKRKELPPLVKGLL